MKNAVPRAALIHDMSGFGRCSLTVALPIISALGAQGCPIPTALLSTHTGGFENYTFLDLSEEMERIIAHWESLDLVFDCVYSGFLGSPGQADTVSRFIDRFRHDGFIAVVDPVFGDNGKLYPTMDDNMVKAMRGLISKADVITPNPTETAFLLELPPVCGAPVSSGRAREQAEALADLGAKNVVITGIEIEGKGMCVAVFDKIAREYAEAPVDYIPGSFHGTGDIFTSVLTGKLLTGLSTVQASKVAADFVRDCIAESLKFPDIPYRDGLPFEKLLYSNLYYYQINKSTNKFVDDGRNQRPF